MARRDLASMLETSYVLFSCEGTAEGVVIEKLVEANALVVPKEHVVEDSLYFKPYTRLRKAEDIAERFLRTSYEGDGASGLVVARIVDSKAGKFTFSRRWKGACDVESFYTRPEIEMLAIHAEDAYDNWRRASRRNRALRPSEFCKGELGLRHIKEGDFLREYWDADKLVEAIRKYAGSHGADVGEWSLADLLA